MEREKDYLDVFVDALFPGDTKEEKEIRDSFESLKKSVNAFISGFASVVGEDKAMEELNKTCACQKTKECDKSTCDCHKYHDTSADKDFADKNDNMIKTKAEMLKSFYEEEEKRKNVELRKKNIENYICDHLTPKEAGGNLEKCGDILRLPILDRVIVAEYSVLDSETKSDVVHELILDTGFSGISFETVNKSELYVLFRF